MVSFNLMNGGTGPAIIEWFRLKWNGQPATSAQDLLERCCGRGKPVKIRSTWNDIASGTTLPARETRIVFGVRASDSDPELRKSK